MRLAEVSKVIKPVIVAWYTSLSPVMVNIALFFSWLLYNTSPSRGFSSASSVSSSVRCVRALKTSAIRASGVERYTLPIWVLGIEEALIVESRGYIAGSDRVEEGLSGLLLGDYGDVGIGVCSRVEDTIVVFVSLSVRWFAGLLICCFVDLLV